MRTTLLGITLLTTALSAQSFVTSPQGYLAREGRGVFGDFGNFPAARQLIADGNFRGAAMQVKELALRIEAGSPAAGIGRRWSAIRLHVGACDATKPVTTFSQVAIGTPSLVFNGSVSWPTLTGWSPNRPAPWTMRFPFRTTFNHTGRHDLFTDFDFNGGQLSNSGTWSNTQPQSYTLDYAKLPAFARAPNIYHPTNSGCRDSSSRFTAFANIDAESYGRVLTGAPFLRVLSHAFFTAPGKPCLHALSFGGVPTGVPGVACNRLYLDLRAPHLFQLGTGSSIGHSFNGWALTPFQQNFVGVRLWLQAAWSDSRTGQLHLTGAATAAIVPPPSDNRWLLQQPTPSKKNGSGKLFRVVRTGTPLPVVRYQR